MSSFFLLFLLVNGYHHLVVNGASLPNQQQQQGLQPQQQHQLIDLTGIKNSGHLITVPNLIRRPVLPGSGNKVYHREYTTTVTQHGPKLVQQPNVVEQPNIVVQPPVVQQNLRQQLPLQQQRSTVQQQQPQQQIPVLQQPQQQQQQQQSLYSGYVVQPVQSGSVPVPIQAAIQSRRFVQVIPYVNPLDSQPVQPQLIEVDAITAPVQFVFRSASGPLLFQQVHLTSPQVTQPQIQHTRSEEQPQLLSHEVYKPVVQDLREIIQPFRRITQEIKPVVEEVHTLVARGERPQQSPLPLSTSPSSSSSSSSTSPVAASSSVVVGEGGVGGDVVEVGESSVIQPASEQIPTLAQGQSLVSTIGQSSSSSSSSASSTSQHQQQVSGLRTSQIVEQKTESLTEF